jgi:hypothetical protein
MISNQYSDAINLMIEDLHQKHHSIRTTAKKLKCEIELDEVKDLLIQHLGLIRTELL